MKKTLSFIMAVLLCLGLCSCKKEENNTQTLENQENIETVSLNQLLADTENLARKQLNNGKKTTVYGCVSAITAKACTVVTFLNSELFFRIELPLEVLAKMEVGLFVVIDAILVEDQGSSASTYIAKATEFENHKSANGQKILDQYIRDLISESLSDSPKYAEENTLKEKTNADLIASYMYVRDTEFQLKSDEEIKNYLVGGVWTLDEGDAVFFGNVEFYADQTYNWHLYFDADPISSYWKDSENSWSVENGKIDAIWPYPIAIYVVDDNLFYAPGYGFRGGYIQRSYK